MADAGHGVVTTEWADGEYTFRLEWKHWHELQEKCKCGPNELLERLVSRRWLVDDIAEVIRLGLIGGGKTPVQALQLVKRYVHERPLLESVGVATSIVAASLMGPISDDMGERPVATENATPAARSISESSTETVQ